jgi:hypothetical protein
MGSIDLFKSVRGAYRSKNGFDEHTTTRHSVPDPFDDKVKGAWFCARKGLLKANVNATEAPDCYPLDCLGKTSGKVLNCFVDVEEKGNAKVKDNFNSKLYESFSDLRFELLT